MIMWFRIFVVLTYFDIPKGKDSRKTEPVINCPIYELGNNRVIIGLLVVVPESVWMVPRLKGNGFMKVRYDIYFI